MTPRSQADTLKRLTELHAHGMSQREIANELGITRHRVVTLARQAGLKWDQSAGVVAAADKAKRGRLDLETRWQETAADMLDQLDLTMASDYLDPDQVWQWLKNAATATSKAAELANVRNRETDQLDPQQGIHAVNSIVSALLDGPAADARQARKGTAA